MPSTTAASPAAPEAASQGSAAPAPAAPQRTSKSLVHVSYKFYAENTWRDYFEAFFLFLVALGQRLLRLEHPNELVFDEHYFGKFTNFTHAGTYYFDIHPTLGKLVFWFISSLFNYDHTRCSYEEIGDEYADDCDYMTLRYIAATFGALLIPLCYLTTRELGASRLGGLLAATLVMCDNLNLIESRLILTDSQLMFSLGLAFYVAVKFWRRISVGPQTLVSRNYQGDPTPVVYPDAYSSARPAPSQPQPLTPLQRLLWATAVGATCGAAISVKWTGLATPGLIAVECAFGLFFLRRTVPLLDLLWMAVSAAVVYIIPFYIHFSLLPYSGEGDAHMNLAFQRSLLNNTNYDPNATPPSFLENFVYLQGEMLRSNAGVDVRHHWESYWWSWPINTRGVLYWDKPDGPLKQVIYLLGNPGVVWLVSAVMGLTMLSMLVHKRWNCVNLACFQRWVGAREANDPHRDTIELVSSPSAEATLAIYKKTTDFYGLQSVLLYLLIEYMFAILPYVGVERSCFIYHHLPSLYYGEILAALAIDRVAGRYRGWVIRSVLAVVFVTWLYFAPWVYGTAMTPEAHDARRWVSTWN